MCPFFRLYKEERGQILRKHENKGKSFAQACKELGFKGCARGFTANAALKEGPFVVGYQILAPQGKAFMRQYIDNEQIAATFGSVGAGLFTAVVTQPGAVIRGKMQSDPCGKVYTSTLQTAQKICQQEGAAGLLNGLKQRGARVAIAIPLYVAYGNAMEEWMKKE